LIVTEVASCPPKFSNKNNTHEHTNCFTTLYPLDISEAEAVNAVYATRYEQIEFVCCWEGTSV